MISKQDVSVFFNTKGKLIVLLSMVFFAFWLLADFGSHETDKRKYEIKCLDDNGLYYHFFKYRGDWWTTAHGTLIVKDIGKKYTFERRRCTYKPID